MDAADLRIFQAVALSGSIRSLEDELGAVLFERTNRGVTLTNAGRRLLPFAARAARVLDDARRAVADEGVPSGTLIVGSLETTAALHLANTIARFAAEYPTVDLSLRTGTTCELIEQVLDRRLDGAFVCGPVNHPDLKVEPFVSEELVILTAPSIADFDMMTAKSDLRIIVLKAGCSYRLHLEAILARRGIVGMRQLEFGSLETIISCVSAGLGVTLLPRALIGSVWEAGRVRVHPLPNNAGWVETVFVRHREAYASSALSAFLNLSRLEFAAVAAAG
jgi:LysR family transcriptional regulator, cell division regulator